MSEKEQGTFKPQFGAELNIESIIGAPLVAASKANVMTVSYTHLTLPTKLEV